MSEVYWLFACQEYESRGGMDEFRGVFSTEEKAIQAGKQWEKYLDYFIYIVKVVDGIPVRIEDTETDYKLDQEV